MSGVVEWKLWALQTFIRFRGNNWSQNAIFSEIEIVNCVPTPSTKTRALKPSILPIRPPKPLILFSLLYCLVQVIKNTVLIPAGLCMFASQVLNKMFHFCLSEKILVLKFTRGKSDIILHVFEHWMGFKLYFLQVRVCIASRPGMGNRQSSRSKINIWWLPMRSCRKISQTRR